MKITKIKETYAYNEGDITIYVRIDYKNGLISLMEKNGDKYTPKSFQFVNRKIEYMAGWSKILDVMQDAIENALAKLKIFQDEREKELVDMAIKLTSTNDLKK